MEPELFHYLALYSSLQKFAFFHVLAKDDRESDQFVNRFFDTVLLKHVISIQDLAVPASPERIIPQS